MKVLILGGKGLIGSNLINNFSKNNDLKVYATSREIWSKAEKEVLKDVSLFPKLTLGKCINIKIIKTSKAKHCN